MAKFLFIDGGGVFGVGPCMSLSLARGLENLSGVGGASIGSALAAQIAIGGIPKLDFFNNWMPIIFNKKRLGSPFFRPLYDDGNINTALISLFQGKMINETNIPFFCTAISMAENNIRIFSSNNENDAVWPLWEVIRASCSAPTFFTSWRGMTDGGLFINNSSMIGCCWAKKVLGCPFEEMDVFSLGCGYSLNVNKQPNNTLIDIAPWILRASIEGSSERIQDYFVRSLPLKSYTRATFTREEKWKMDNIKDMKEAERRWSAEAMIVTESINEFLKK